jgi:hypothetical protein
MTYSTCMAITEAGMAILPYSAVMVTSVKVMKVNEGYSIACDLP